MSKFPVEKQIKELSFVFNKIRNEKLAQVFEMIAFASGKAKPIQVDPNLFLGLEGEEKRNAISAAQDASDTLAIFEALGDEKMEYIRNLFFSKMIVEGIGLVADKLEEILEEDLSLYTEMFSIAFEVYLGKHIKKASGK